MTVPPRLICAAALALLTAGCAHDTGGSSGGSLAAAPAAPASTPAPEAPGAPASPNASDAADPRGPAAVPQNRARIGSLRGTRTTVQPARIMGRYSASEVNSVGHAMPIEIHGTPPDGGSDETIVPLIRMPHHFSVRAMELVPGRYGGKRVVVEFGSNASGPRLCTDPRGARQGWDQSLTAAFAFCVQGQFTSGTVLRSGTIEGPTDPNFANAMSNAMLVLLPRDNPEVDRGSRRRRRR